MKKLLLSAVGIMFMLVFTNCEKEKLENDFSTRATKAYFSGDPEGCEGQTNTFIAGQNITVGGITTVNDEYNLYVIFNLTGNWKMGMTHIYVGSKEGMPTNKKGNPKIGNFPHKFSHDPMVNQFVFTIPLTEIDQECFVLAVHAEVHHFNINGQIDQSETAWAEGLPMTNKGSWAMYYNYCLCHDTLINSN